MSFSAKILNAKLQYFLQYTVRPGLVLKERTTGGEVGSYISFILTAHRLIKSIYIDGKIKNVMNEI